MLAFAVLAATAGGFVALRSAFEPSMRGPAIDRAYALTQRPDRVLP